MHLPRAPRGRLPECLARDVYGRQVSVLGDGRRRVGLYAETHGDDADGFLEVRVVELA